MYAAIHPDGLVIFSRDSLFNTRTGPTANPADVLLIASNNNGSRRRGPPGVIVEPVDPWWIRLAETESPRPTRNPNNDGETMMIDWVNRVRVKVANETTTTKAFQSTTTTTTPKPPAFPVHQTTTKKPNKSKYPFIDIPEYDENAVIYNYKSYQLTGVHEEPDAN